TSPLLPSFPTRRSSDLFPAATAVAVLGTAQVDDLLDRLVEQSLLAVVDDPLTSSIRFRMLETVREFGIARLAAEGRTAVGWNGRSEEHTSELQSRENLV